MIPLFKRYIGGPIGSGKQWFSWIHELGNNYEYAVIGHPKRKYCWILSRTKTMKDDLYEAIIYRLKAAGYDTSKLIKSNQR